MPAAAGVSSRPSAWRWLAATRPAFLSLTLLGWLIGVAASHPSAALRGGLLLALLGAVLLHALANVVNDVADDANGGDAVNTGLVFPFTGGRRLIQDGVLPAEQVMPSAPWQIQAKDLDAEAVAAALLRRGGPRHATAQGQLQMFPDT